MLLSEEHRKINLKYIKSKLSKLPIGKILTDRVYIARWDGFPNRKKKYYMINGRVGKTAKKLILERERLEALQQSIESDTVYDHDKKKFRKEPLLMDRNLFISLSHKADSNTRMKRDFSPIAGNTIVRSKSEQNIASFLTSMGIEWIYEPCLVWDDKQIHPDFVCYAPEVDKTYFLEHLGMLDNENYLDDAMQKIRFYIKSGFVPGRDIIFTFESKQYGFDINQLANAIDELIKNNY